MTKQEAFLLILKNGSLKKLSMLRNILALPVGENPYVNIVGNKFNITIGDSLAIVEADTTKPLIDLNEELVLPAGSMKIVDQDIRTTYGRAIVNYIMMEYALNAQFPYRNEEFTYSDLDKDIIKPGLSEGTIQIKDLKSKIVNSAIFLRSLADIVVVAVTEKMVFAPTDLNKFKSDIKKEYTKKYGEDWVKDDKIVLEYETKIEEFYKDYLRDDPTYGITLDNKMFKSIKTRRIAIGILNSIDPSANNDALLTSLYDGLPFDDPDKLSIVFNNIVYGSSNRGELTQIGGVISKVLTRATHHYMVDKEDCGVTYGMVVPITSDMEGRTLVNGVKLDSTNIKSYIGKELEIRSLVRCKASGEHFCKVCAGDDLSRLPDSILLVALSVGGSILKHFLSKFHSSHSKLIKITKRDLF